jgi:hypothetical protein
MPRAPRPARSLPGMLMRLKNGRSAGVDGTGLSFPSHSTNLGAFGSPNTKSSLSPLSTYARACSPFSVQPFKRNEEEKGRRARSTYCHGEDGIGRLEAVGPLFPEVPLVGALGGGDVAAGAGAGLRDDHVVHAVPRGQRLRGAEAADASAHHDAVRRYSRAGRRRRLGRVAGHRAAHTSPAGTRKGSWRTERRRRRGGDHFRRGRLLGALERGGAEWMTRGDAVGGVGRFGVDLAIDGPTTMGCESHSRA